MKKLNYHLKDLLGLMLVGLVTNVAAAQDDEPDVDAMIAEARSHIGAEEFVEAAEILKKAVKADDENALAWQLLGYSLHGAGKLDEAIKAHEQAATFRPTAALGNYNLCCAYSLKKEPKKALEYLEKAFKAGFRNFNHMEGDSDLDNIRDDEGYIELVKRAKKGMDSVPETKEKEEAESEDDPVAELEPEVRTRLEEASDLIQNEEFEQAAGILKELVKEAPKVDLIWFQYGFALHASGELDEAIKVHKKTVELKQRMAPIAQYNLGCAYSLKKDLDKSFEALNEAVKMGYADIEQFESDDDLKNLRDDDRYDELIAKVEQKQEELRKKLREMRNRQREGSRPDF